MTCIYEESQNQNTDMSDLNTGKFQQRTNKTPIALQEGNQQQMPVDGYTSVIPLPDVKYRKISINERRP